MPRKQILRGRYLIQMHGKPLHQYDTVYHKNGLKDYVEYVYNDDEDLYIYTTKGYNWNVKNLSHEEF